MTARLLLFFAMLCGLACAPVKPVMGCAVVLAAPGCGSCCQSAEHSCCAASNAPTQPLPLSGNVSADGKQVVAPTLIFLCLSPAPATASPAGQRRLAARRPALPLRDLICVRLV